MKRFPFFVAFALFLTACGPATLSYNITFDTDNAARMTDLSLALRRVTERRLARLEANLTDFDVDHNKETLETSVSIEVDSTKAAAQLNDELLAPFSFEMRYVVDPETEEEGDITVEGLGSFRATGVEGTHIDWVLGEAMEGPLDQGKVIIGFTDEGVSRMQNVLHERDGTTIGLFVRGRLTASLQVDGDSITRTIEIPGLPSAELANIFADDMNVGIHMTLSPAS
ncbi:MAG: hypothetical protein KC680_01335 [Candidatus Peregrinibacteria bacterium]|nr:hypothetical protein [Candidatus Peregrinibacteria bacterium]MCB9808130.1 hypothetical protein [Candidatus Peribacteria bacterium]